MTLILIIAVFILSFLIRKNVQENKYDQALLQLFLAKLFSSIVIAISIYQISSYFESSKPDHTILIFSSLIALFSGFDLFRFLKQTVEVKELKGSQIKK
jgi:hypothetical protein